MSDSNREIVGKDDPDKKAESPETPEVSAAASGGELPVAELESSPSTSGASGGVPRPTTLSPNWTAAGSTSQSEASAISPKRSPVKEAVHNICSKALSFVKPKKKKKKKCKKSKYADCPKTLSTMKPDLEPNDANSLSIGPPTEFTNVADTDSSSGDFSELDESDDAPES